MITVKTKIGYGCPAKEGKASAHGEPLGADNVAALKENLGWPSQEPFYVPDEVYANYKEKAKKGAEAEEAWNKLFADYCKAYPEMKKLWDEYFDENAAEKVLNDENFWSYEDKPQATRNLSGVQINKLKNMLPNLMGGSADLAPSTKTTMPEEICISA